MYRKGTEVTTIAPIRPAIPPPVTISRVTIRGTSTPGVLGEPAVVPGQPDLVAERRPGVDLHDQRDDDDQDQRGLSPMPANTGIR